MAAFLPYPMAPEEESDQVSGLGIDILVDRFVTDRLIPAKSPNSAGDHLG